mgnify:CR=1 FL=1
MVELVVLAVLVTFQSNGNIDMEKVNSYIESISIAIYGALAVIGGWIAFKIISSFTKFLSWVSSKLVQTLSEEFWNIIRNEISEQIDSKIKILKDDIKSVKDNLEKNQDKEAIIKTIQDLKELLTKKNQNEK